MTDQRTVIFYCPEPDCGEKVTLNTEDQLWCYDNKILTPGYCSQHQKKYLVKDYEEAISEI